MHRSRLLLVVFLLALPSAFGQATPTDPHTLQALLAEVRQLRQDLQTASVSTQRTQILLFRLQIQEATVARMERRFDEAHSNLVQTQFELKRLGSEIKLREDTRSDTQNAGDRKELEEVLPRLKAEFESLKSTEQQLLARESEAEQELRAEGAKLNALEGQLDMVDKSLDIPNR
jgi:chromosome segregation ATPase